jgi:hypothetical protein
MRLRSVLATATLVLLVFGALTMWYSTRPEPLPNPIASFPFEVSRKGAEVDARVQIPGYRSWWIVVWFETSNYDDAMRVLHLFDENRTKGIYPISVPVHITVQKLGSEASLPVVVLDRDVPTIQPYGGYEHHYGRSIVTINLQPGLYRIQAEALADNPKLDRTPTTLAINYNAKFLFAANAINPARGE